MRAGEAQDVHYHFVDEETFSEVAAEGRFMEWEEYRGHRYGTPWSEIDRALVGRANLILELDVRGALSIKRRYPQGLTIFLDAPSRDVLESRLRGRGTDTEEQVRARLAAADEEMATFERTRGRPGGFDHVVVNDEVERAATEIARILEHWTPDQGGPAGVEETT